MADNNDGKYLSENNPFFPYTHGFEELTFEDQTRILRLECSGGSAAYERRHIIQNLRVCSSCWTPIDEPNHCTFCFKQCVRCRYYYKEKDTLEVTSVLVEVINGAPVELRGHLCKWCNEIKKIVYGEVPEIKEPEVN